MKYRIIEHSNGNVSIVPPGVEISQGKNDHPKVHEVEATADSVENLRRETRGKKIMIKDRDGSILFER